jgi:hypothetical protein
MSQYEELWKAFIEGEKRFSRYRDEAWDFAEKFAGGLLDFLGCQQHNMRVVPLGDEQDLEKTYTIAGALNYDDNGYWSMGILLTVRNPESDRPGTITLVPQARSCPAISTPLGCLSLSRSNALPGPARVLSSDYRDE